MRGLNTKLGELIRNISTQDFDIYILTETNLNDSVVNSQLGFLNFNVFRFDRRSTSSCKVSGGGSLVAVHKKFHARLLTLHSDCVELVFVLISSLDSKLIIGGVYIPPQSNCGKYDSVSFEIDQIFSYHPDAKFILLGDFNIPEITWCDGKPSKPLTFYPANCQSVIESCSIFDLSQVNNVLNYKGRVLDLVLTNVPTCSVSSARPDDYLVRMDPYHPH